jgi:hypothetical protein
VEVAILDGDESFFLKFVQHFLFFGEEIAVIPVVEVFEVTKESIIEKTYSPGNLP